MLKVEGYDDPVTFLIDQKYLARPIFRTLNSDAGLTLTEKDVGELSRAIDVPEQMLNRLGTDTQRNLKILSAVEDLITRHDVSSCSRPPLKTRECLRQYFLYVDMKHL